jgi:hypothetical protein
VLGYPASFGRDHVRLADGVQQSGLVVIDVTHDRHDRRAGDQVLLVTLVRAEGQIEGLEQLAVLVLRTDHLDGVIQLCAEQLQRVLVDRLGGGHHLAGGTTR